MSVGKALAETYVLYTKTQAIHWNVVGPLFYALHKLTEQQYEDLAEAIDELAERIRALDSPAPGSFRCSANDGVNASEAAVAER